MIDILRQRSPAEIAELMSLSDPLATLNVARYAQWSRPFSPDNAKQAVLAFNGDV
ncbi:peroxide stress protein YaaA [Thauera humireducens]|uniref:peroxide stress protein YaaA n=1 Tax=Thauera humireducens TaxID=1134435 RepID=UPI00311F2F75